MKIDSQTFDTGDVNFVAAAMTMGFPLNENKPCSIIQRDNGRNYARFHLYTISMDDSLEINSISAWWTNPDNCLNKPFSSIMAMIKEGISQGGISTSEDWLDFIIENLTHQGITHHPKNMDDIPQFIDRVGEHTLEAQLCAFAYNREWAFQIMKQANRSIMLTHGRTSHAHIDEQLPKWKRNEILARLRS